jgi:hypothetical protein
MVVHDSRKFKSHTKFHEIPFSRSRDVLGVETNGSTDGVTVKANLRGARKSATYTSKNQSMGRKLKCEDCLVLMRLFETTAVGTKWIIIISKSSF